MNREIKKRKAEKRKEKRREEKRRKEKQRKEEKRREKKRKEKSSVPRTRTKSDTLFSLFFSNISGTVKADTIKETI